MSGLITCITGISCACGGANRDTRSAGKKTQRDWLQGQGIETHTSGQLNCRYSRKVAFVEMNMTN